jgi:hypothetical protein
VSLAVMRHRGRRIVRRKRNVHMLLRGSGKPCYGKHAKEDGQSQNGLHRLNGVILYTDLVSAAFNSFALFFSAIAACIVHKSLRIVCV